MKLKPAVKWGLAASLCIALPLLFAHNFLARVLVIPRLYDEAPLGGVFVVWREFNFERCQTFDTLFDRMYPDLSMQTFTKQLEANTKQIEAFLKHKTSANERAYKEGLAKDLATIEEQKQKKVTLLRDVQKRSLLRLPATHGAMRFCSDK